MAGVELAPGGDAITLGGAGEGTWTGPWVRPGFDFEEVIPSWNAEAPPGSLVQVELQALTPAGAESGWYVLGRWALDDTAFGRTSVGGQADDFGDVDTDTFRAATALAAYRLRLTLSAGAQGAPTVRMVAAIASAGARDRVETSTAGGGAGIELAVPPYSQSIHAGEYPEYDNGGASWCSPTSTAMVIAYWGTGPTAADYAWVDPGYEDPWVDHAARFTYDHGYGGAGNWAFNTAYAAQFGLDAFVTRLRSLREAEAFLRGGDSSRRLDRGRARRARRLSARAGNGRASRRDRRLHLRRATRSSTTRLRRRTQPSVAPTTGPSSSVPGSVARGASST